MKSFPERGSGVAQADMVFLGDAPLGAHPLECISSVDADPATNLFSISAVYPTNALSLMTPGTRDARGTHLPIYPSTHPSLILRMASQQLQLAPLQRELP